jgi:hypothetical protein
LTRGKVAGIIHRYKEQEGAIREGITVEADNNTQEITSKSPRIKTLAQLIDACDIDLDEWIIERHVVNKWEVGAKGANKEVRVHPLFQVKVWLVKRVPEMVTPVIQPLSISIRAAKIPKTRNDSDRKRAVTLADPHFGFSVDLRTRALTPFHDRRALSVALQIVKDAQPDEVVWKGDINDMAEWSDKFIRGPEFYFTTQPAIIEAAWWIAQFKLAAPNAEHTVIGGNHDDRVDKSIMTHLLAAYNLKSADNIDGPAVLSLTGLLGLDSVGVNYADGEHWLTDDIRCIHGDIAKQAPGATARATNDKANETTIFGHIHRTELTTRTIHERNGQRTLTAFCPGCLCRVDGVVPPGRCENWQQGIAVLDYEPQGEPAITPIRIIDGHAYHAGNDYSGDGDIIERLESDTGWKFS